MIQRTFDAGRKPKVANAHMKPDFLSELKTVVVKQR
jgi:hypothetical protein